MLRGDIIIFACVLCLSKCHTVLKKNEKNVFKNLSKMQMCFYCGDVAERIWRWYCHVYALVSNVVMAFEYQIWAKYRLRVW